MFSKNVYALRIKKRITLRDFCHATGFSTSEWGKIERDIDPPPTDMRILTKIAKALDLRAAGKQSLIKQAIKDDKNFKPKPMPKFHEIMPPFLCTADNRKLTKDDIKGIYEMLLEAYRPTKKSEKASRRKTCLKTV